MKASSRRDRSVRTFSICILILVAILSTPVRPAAHEIPTDITLRTFVHVSGETLRFLVRVPLAAMRDFQWPLRDPGYLDIEAATPMLEDAAQMWIADYITFYEEGAPIEDGRIAAVRLSRPSDRSFDELDAAVAHVTGPGMDPGRDLFWEQALLDVMLEYPIVSEESDFALEPRLAHLGIQTNTVLNFVLPGGEVRAYQYHGDPGLLRLDPRWYHALLRFVGSGIHHILIGFDHLLFLLCLIIPYRSIRGLIPVVTSFTVAHSITLLASAFGMVPQALWFPPFIEALIALSIVYMAFENIVGANIRRRWLITFGFGLVHGFGFSFVLAEQLQFAGSHLVTSLLAFNLGVELGQILVLILVVPLLRLLFRYGLKERLGVIILSALVAHTAWHWSADRGAEFLEYDVRLPALDAAFFAGAIQWLIIALIAGGLAWAMYEIFEKWEALRPEDQTAASGSGIG